MNKETYESLRALEKQARGVLPIDPIFGKVEPGAFYWLAHPPFPCEGAQVEVTTKVTATSREAQIDAVYELAGHWKLKVWPHIRHFLSTIPEKPFEQGGKIVELLLHPSKERGNGQPSWNRYFAPRKL